MSWLKLSDSLYFMGPGGVTRLEANAAYNVDGTRSKYVTALYDGKSQLTVVTESVEEIAEKLGVSNESKDNIPCPGCGSSVICGGPLFCAR